MNPAVLLFASSRFGLKKVVTLVAFAVMGILALPVAVALSVGPDTINWLANTPDAKAAEQQGFYMGGAVEGNTYVWGNCTWWVYSMRLWAGSPIPNWWGNANTWDDNAKAQSYIVNHTPAVGAVFQTDEGGWGHVAYVIKVDAVSGDWTISEMNAPKLNVVSQRTFSSGSAAYYNFIHSKIGAPAWTPTPITSNPPYGTGP